MSPSEDAPPSRWPWLDGWFAPRWRALLTWAILAVFSAAILSGIGYERCENWALFMLLRFTPVPVSGAFQRSVVDANLILLLVWFEPFSLRLNLLRGACWLGFRIVSFVAAAYLPYQNDDVWGAWELFLPAAGMMIILWGWRNRPWMAFIGGALSFSIYEIATKIPDFRVSLYWISMFYLPYAVVLIYGTRLLRPEERGPRQS